MVNNLNKKILTNKLNRKIEVENESSIELA